MQIDQREGVCGECGLCEGVRRVKEFIQELVQIDQREGVCVSGGWVVCVWGVWVV